MIFADKLINLRKKNGWSQEDLAEKMDVSRQTISKWEGALSMPDLGRMLKLAQLFGVTTDYLIKDEQELPECTPESEAEVEDDFQTRRVSMEQAVEFLRLRDLFSGRIALGVMLCIFSPIPLILLCAAQESHRLAMTEDFAAGLGLVILFLMVASAVGIFIHSGLKLQPYEFLEHEPIETAYGVEGMVHERKNSYAPRHTRLLISGILLCVLCPTPLFAAMALLGDDWSMVLATAALLIMVGIGVLCIVRTCTVWGSFQLLLEEGDYTRNQKQEAHRNSTISSIYWGVVTAAYLAYSFITGNWGSSWIVWPVAGVSYGVLVSVLRVLRKNQQ